MRMVRGKQHAIGEAWDQFDGQLESYELVSYIMNYSLTIEPKGPEPITQGEPGAQ